MAQLYLQKKDFTSCLETCEQIISFDSCREEAYRLMISCHLQLKQKTLAVQAYHRCKDNLAKHLAIRPSRELYALLKNNISGL
ncbi:MAG: bacterial transcriptional activator domain-containing protein [Peptococcia bacterium]